MESGGGNAIGVAVDVEPTPLSFTFEQNEGDHAPIPAGLHERFKQACQAEGKSMTTVLVGLLETWLQLRE